MNRNLKNKEIDLRKYPLFLKLIFKKREQGGFALPQILVLAIGISITLVGLMNVSINRLLVTIHG